MFPCNQFPIQPCGILQARANAICTLLWFPSYSSPLERHRNIWRIMGWWEVINATSRNSPACAACGHNCLTQLASCRSLFTGVWRHSAVQLLLVFRLWHPGSSRIGSHDYLADLGKVKVTSSLEPRLRFVTQASPKSNNKPCSNPNLRGSVRLKDSDEKRLSFSKLHIYLLVRSHTGSNRFLPSERFSEMSISDKAPLTEIVLQSSEHTSKPQIPATQNASNIP
ncbi:hypothetical protein O181_085166 [Austropuccinia psidii MF-1]|uniref:Uncharacterized protein n=1 Tax=Austropuccinia psidii MF-1 TaxID=1389203 RepID=A0A9Q3FXU9_9BASI|nr:hypothetical protein [Austropuccinia psidii MF-1]